MPYINQYDRKILGSRVYPRTPGELNYLLTNAVIDYLDFHGTTYQTINDCLGALEAAKLEFYRRVVVPYEEIKIDENGDVYP